MAGATPSEAGQTSAGSTGWTEEEERRKEVRNLSATWNTPLPRHTDPEDSKELLVEQIPVTEIELTYFQNKIKGNIV